MNSAFRIRRRCATTPPHRSINKPLIRSIQSRSRISVLAAINNHNCQSARERSRAHSAEVSAWKPNLATPHQADAFRRFDPNIWGCVFVLLWFLRVVGYFYFFYSCFSSSSWPHKLRRRVAWLHANRSRNSRNEQESKQNLDLPAVGF